MYHVPPTAFVRARKPEGDQLATIERDMYAETVAGRPSRYQGCGRDLADGYDAVLAYVDRLDAEAKAIIGELSDADLERKCQTPAGLPITTWKWPRDGRARGSPPGTDLSDAQTCWRCRRRHSSVSRPST